MIPYQMVKYTIIRNPITLVASSTLLYGITLEKMPLYVSKSKLM